MEWGSLAILGLATFAGALVQAATGFGFAIIAAPVFLAVMNSTVAIAVLVALHVVQSAMVLPKVWNRASKWHLKRLVLGALIGCPLGFWAFRSLDVRTLKVLIGVIILAVIGLLIWRELGAVTGQRKTGAQRGTPLTLMTGMISGAMTSLLVMPGPPLMVYFMSERAAGDSVRALSLTFFGLCYVAVTMSNVMAGSLGGRAWEIVGWLAPVVVLGTVAGVALSRHFSEAGFRWAVLALLLLSGIGAIVSALL